MQCPKCNYERQDSDTNPDWQCPSCGIAYVKFGNTPRKVYGYTPNHVPLGERLIYLIISAYLIVYGAKGLSNDDLVVSTRRNVYHLHGTEAAIMYAAFIFGALSMITVILDHYDKRENEATYWFFSRFFGISALVIALISPFAR